MIFLMAEPSMDSWLPFKHTVHTNKSETTTCLIKISSQIILVQLSQRLSHIISTKQEPTIEEDFDMLTHPLELIQRASTSLFW